MPYVQKPHITRLPLPSDTSYYVDWRDAMLYRDMKAAMKQAVKLEDGEMKTDTSAMSDALLLGHIESWNLDDEEGATLPITAESLDLLRESDVQFLLSKAQDTQESEETKRKNAQSSSARSSGAR